MKTLTIFLTTTPYAYENTHTTLELTRAALDKGHAVNLFASADGVYNFTRGHQAKGIPNAVQGFSKNRDKQNFTEEERALLNVQLARAKSSALMRSQPSKPWRCPSAEPMWKRWSSSGP